MAASCEVRGFGLPAVVWWEKYSLVATPHTNGKPAAVTKIELPAAVFCPFAASRVGGPGECGPACISSSRCHSCRALVSTPAGTGAAAAPPISSSPNRACCLMPSPHITTCGIKGHGRYFHWHFLERMFLPTTLPAIYKQMTADITMPQVWLSSNNTPRP